MYKVGQKTLIKDDMESDGEINGEVSQKKQLAFIFSLCPSVCEYCLPYSILLAQGFQWSWDLFPSILIHDWC